MSAHPAPPLVRDARPAPRRPGSPGRGSWLVPAALVLLGLVPVASGVLRVVEVLGGPALLPANPRVDAVPAPVVVHVVASVVCALLGAWQFSAGFRRRHRAWHRRAGRVLVGAGLLVAGSGVVMTLLHPDAPGGAALWAVRLVVGATMAAALVLGVAAVRRHDLAGHRAWMVRAYALGLGAGTQILTEGIGEALMGAGARSKALSLTAGWLLNAAIAEWVIRRRGRRARGPAGGLPLPVP